MNIINLKCNNIALYLNVEKTNKIIMKKINFFYIYNFICKITLYTIKVIFFINFYSFLLLLFYCIKCNILNTKSIVDLKLLTWIDY